MKRYGTGALATVAALAIATSGQAQDVRGREGRTFTWSERVPAGQWLRVYTLSGNVEVSEGSGEAEVQAVKRITRGDYEDIAFEIVKSSDGVTICAIYEGATDCDDDGLRRRARSSNISRNRNVDITVRLPRGVKIVASSGTGTVLVRGATADVRAASGNGRVRVGPTNGPVNASSGNGAVTVERAGGPVRASSGNGAVTVNTMRGPVSASSGNGDLEITMDQLSDSDEDMEFSTGNGRVSIIAPDNLSAEIEATLGHGQFQSDFAMTMRGRISPTHIRGRIGSGGTRRITISSGNGDVELRKR